MSNEAPRKAGRPKKQPAGKPFVGFTAEDLESSYFRMPTVWMLMCAEIDNLAELKVVQYVIRHTYGYINKKTGKPMYDQLKKITVDEFVNGRKSGNERMDFGTGLSDKAVKEGLTRAVEHGFLVVTIDDSDKARIKKYYGLKVQEVEQELVDDDFFDAEEGGITIPSEGNINPPNGEYHSHRSKNERIERTLEEKNIRNTHPSENELGNIRHLPIKRGKAEGPLFIKQMMEDFSRDCGDAEHTASNVTRAYNLYNASGIDPDAFSEALYEARDQARKASVKKQNSQGRPNRIPYFFRCLEKSLGIKHITESSVN